MKNIVYTAILSIVSYLILFGLCKLIGRQQIAQLSMFDYVNSITIGSIAAELATNLEEWEKPLTALLIYGFITAAISVLSCKSLKVRHFVNGKPLLLYEKGKLYQANLAKAHLDLNSFLEQCRMGGYFDLSQLNMVFAEPSGQFSFLPFSDQRPVTPSDMALKVEPEELWLPLVMDGKLLEQNLTSSGQTRDWLMKQLHSQNIGQLSETLFAACDPNGGFFACRKTTKGSDKDFF